MAREKRPNIPDVQEFLTPEVTDPDIYSVLFIFNSEFFFYFFDFVNLKFVFFKFFINDQRVGKNLSKLKCTFFFTSSRDLHE